MKILKYINAFAISLPFLLAFLGIFDEGFLFGAMLSTMVTGALQVIIALILLANNYKNIHLLLYFSATIIFFILWLGFGIEYELFLLPPILAIYLTCIIYKLSTTHS